MATQEDIIFKITADITNAVKGLQDLAKSMNITTSETKKTGTESEQAATGVSKLYESFKKAKGEILAATAIVAGFAIAVKKAYEFGKMGAQISQLTESFDIMTSQVTNSVEQLTRMKEATRGTVSEFQLMAASNIALAGTSGELEKKLAESIPRLLEIAKASEKVNPLLGDTGFLFQSLTTGIKRLSPRLIDNTGLQIRLSNSYKTLAEARGKSVQELTSEEQQLALLNATLEAGDRLLVQAGNNVDSATDVYARFTAHVTDAKNALAQFADTIVRRVVTGLDIILFGATEINNALETQAGRLKTTSKVWAEYVHGVLTSLVTAKKITQEAADSIEALALETGDLKKAADLYYQSQIKGNEENYVTVAVIEGEVSAIKELVIATGNITASTWDYILAAQAEQLQEQILITNKVNLNLATGELTEETEDLTEATKDYGHGLETVNERSLRLSMHIKQLMEDIHGVTPMLSEFIDSFKVDMGSPIQSFIDQIKWFLAGGAGITAAFEDIRAAISAGLVTPEGAIPALQALLEANQKALLVSGLQSAEDTKENLVVGLGLTEADADAIMSPLTTVLDTITAAENIINFKIEKNDREETLDQLESLFGPGGLRSVDININVTGSGWPNLGPGVGGMFPAGGGGGGGGGGAKGSTALAMGGPVAANIPYIVGERGPELFVPSRDGDIIPNNQLVSLIPNPVSVVIENVTVSDEIDVQLFAYRIADIITRRQRANR